MKLLKEWIGSVGEPLSSPAELLHISEDVDELIRLANIRASLEDYCSEPFWIIPEREEHWSMWMPVRDEFRYVIRG